MTTCTICGVPVVGSVDADVCCTDCDAVNFPPPEDIPLPWWQAVRLRLAANRDGIRALRHVMEQGGIDTNRGDY